MRHRKYLKALEFKKNDEKEAQWLDEAEKAQRVQNFKEQAARQRVKINSLKTGQPQPTK